MENHATFRFYEELNDFLPLDKKKVAFIHSFRGTPSIKDSIEAIGIPHVEVNLILVNKQVVDFNYRLKNNDIVSVYPVLKIQKKEQKKLNSFWMYTLANLQNILECVDLTPFIKMITTTKKLSRFRSRKSESS